MSAYPARLAVSLGLCGLLAAGCKPSFESEGALSIDGQPFRPTRCRVLVDATGIELANETGRRLELTLPPATLRAWREIHGTPTVKLHAAAGAPATDLGPCGSLTMAGEGYHEPNRRAASGRLSLSCSGAASLQGELRFSGCF